MTTMMMMILMTRVTRMMTVIGGSTDLTQLMGSRRLTGQEHQGFLQLGSRVLDWPGCRRRLSVRSGHTDRSAAPHGLPPHDRISDILGGECVTHSGDAGRMNAFHLQAFLAGIGGSTSKESLPASNVKVDTSLKTLDKVNRNSNRALASRLRKSASAHRKRGKVDVCTHPPHHEPWENTGSKDTIEVVSGGAVHGGSEPLSLIMPEARQLTARVKNRAVPSDGTETQPLGRRVPNLKPHFASFTEVQGDRCDDLRLCRRPTLLQFTERSDDIGPAAKVAEHNEALHSGKGFEVMPRRKL